MNTILPKFVDFNNKNAFYNSSRWKPTPNPIYMYIFAILVIVGIIISIIGLRKDIKTHVSAIDVMLAFLGVMMIFFHIYDKTNNLSIAANYTDGGFKIAQTNLMASPYKILSKKDNKSLKPNKNYHSSDYYVYVDLINAKPMGINKNYVINQTSAVYDESNGYSHTKNDNRENIVLLGHMKNNTFIPNYKNKKIVHTFMNYVKYIKKHKLESKFKHHFSFEVSDVYFTKNHDPVLVMIGDNKFTLHYKNNFVVKDTDIIQSN